MNRIETPVAAGPFVVSRADYEQDKKRGYTVLEFSPAGELVLNNPRNPSHKISRPVPAVYMFRCMKCKYDATDTVYGEDPETNAPRNGLDLINLHMYRRDHPWPYNEFENPYGNVLDVIIEGVDDYTKEIEA